MIDTVVWEFGSDPGTMDRHISWRGKDLNDVGYLEVGKVRIYFHRKDRRLRVSVLGRILPPTRCLQLHIWLQLEPSIGIPERFLHQ